MLTEDQKRERDAKRIEVADKFRQAAEARRQADRAAIVSVAGTESGKAFLKYLHRICGQAESSLVLMPAEGKVSAEATLFNEAKRYVYLQVRGHVPPMALREIEIQVTEEKI